MNLILGSGSTGCIAKEILGPNWEWVPFKRSRYYSFDTPYADNFITYENSVTDFVRGIFPDCTPLFYKRAFSYQGQLMFQELPVLLDPYMAKLYGDGVPEHKSKLIKTTFSVYPVTVQMLYHHLEDKYRDTAIRDGVSKFGEVKSIDLDKKILTCTNGTVEFEKMISTIPLNAFLKLCGKNVALKARPVCYYYLVADSVDLEGAQQAMVVDIDISFFKVVMLKEHHYLFWTFEALDNPHNYFGKFLNYRLDIVEAKRIDEAIPIGEVDLKWLEDIGVTCVGSNAQWDDFMDTSSSIKRLLRVASESSSLSGR